MICALEFPLDVQYKDGSTVSGCATEYLLQLQVQRLPRGRRTLVTVTVLNYGIGQILYIRASPFCQETNMYQLEAVPRSHVCVLIPGICDYTLFGKSALAVGIKLKILR